MPSTPLVPSVVPRPLGERSVRIVSTRIGRAGKDLRIELDMEATNLWRHPPGHPPGSFGAVWLFVKYRATTTRRDLDEEALIDTLAPTHHLPRRTAEEVRTRARERLSQALREQAAPGVSRGIQGARDARLRIRLESESDTAPAAANQAPSHERVDHLQVHRKALVREQDTGKSGSSASHSGIIQLVRRQGQDGSISFDYQAPGKWRHAMLSPRSADHHAPHGFEIRATSDGMGVFVQRSAEHPGPGGASLRGVVLCWRPDSDPDRDIEFPVRLWVHAVEMVYVPEGPYELGDPQGLDGPAGCFYSSAPTITEGVESWSYRVQSEELIPVCEACDEPPRPHLTWDNKGQFGTYGHIPATFPKGYKAFYCMRRQLTQGEFADFMNSLHGHAKTVRFPYGGQGFYRYSVFKTEGGLRIATRPSRANNWMSWADAIAWMWWAGLRPMTELEYEKACRGFAAAVPGEFAWGSTVLEQANVVIGPEDGRERVSGNCHIDNAYNVLMGGDGGQGPVRDDSLIVPGMGVLEMVDGTGFAVFERDPADGEQVAARVGDMRACTGASYWGIMGLSGNLWEFVVSAGHEYGRAFTGVHGQGNLSNVGMPVWEEERDGRFPWPDASAEGTGFRGGSWYTPAFKGQVADRSHGAGLEDYNARSHDTGIRAVRTSPEYEDS